jgi:hypothetical protein
MFGQTECNFFYKYADNSIVMTEKDLKLYSYLLRYTLIGSISFISSCTPNKSVDSLIGIAANTVYVPVPLDLQVTIASPDADGKNVGYQVSMSGGCTSPGGVIEFRGDATGFSACQSNNTWSADVDLSSAPVGSVTVNVYLVNGTEESGAATRIFNKENSDCDLEANRTSVFAGGDGSGGDPYRICTSSQLNNIRTSLTSNYILKNDIYMQSVPFTPLPNTFNATFDGNGFTISDLYIYDVSANDVGLFKGIRDGAVIKNLTVENANVNGPSVVGILAGRILGTGATIQDVSVEGRVNGSSNWVGGLVGHVPASADLTILNSDVDVVAITNAGYAGAILGGTAATAGTIIMTDITASGSVTASTTYAGGIVGYLDTPTNTLTNITSSVDVSINGGSSDNYIGGIVGRMDGGDIDNCTSSGLISATGSYVGGVVGQFSGTKLWNCDATGSIQVDATSRASGYVGGIVGYATASSTDIYNVDVLANITVTGVNVSSYYGGIGGRVFATTIDTCEVHGNTTTGAKGILSIDTGDGATTGSNQIGGAFGRFDISNGTSLTVSDCNADVNVTNVGANTNAYVGGFLGYSVPGDGAAGSSITITNSTASGDVVASNRYIGGYLGQVYLPRNGSAGTLTNVHATGDVTVTTLNGISLQYIGGFAGLLSSRDNADAGHNSCSGYQITNVSASGNVDVDSDTLGGSYIGGLVGYLATGRATAGGSTNTVTNTKATGSVTASSTATVFTYVGGLFGRVYNAQDSSLTIDNSGGPVFAVGNVTSFGNAVGGLIGQFDSGTNATTVLQNVYSNGTVSGNRYVGGLLGYVANGGGTAAMTIDNVANHDSNASTAIPTVSGTQQEVGGLIGYANSTSTSFLLSNCDSSSNVTSAGPSAGGLIGNDRANIDITSCTASGDVVAAQGYAGGLTGGSDQLGRDFNDVQATGDVTMTITGVNFSNVYAGGLSGYHRGTITNATSTGDVTINIDAGSSINNSYVGGFVGYANASSINKVYALGSVTYDTAGAGNINYTGGLVGYLTSTSSISNSFATGEVMGGNQTGGLVGRSDGTITDSMAAGNVSGLRYVGGLIGYINSGASSVSQVYSIGGVSRNSGANLVNFGELVGSCPGDNRVVNGYYNTSLSTIEAGLTPFANCNSTTAARALADSSMLSPGAGFAGFSFNCTVTAVDSNWCFPTSFTLKGASSEYLYPILQWANP